MEATNNETEQVADYGDGSVDAVAQGLLYNPTPEETPAAEAEEPVGEELDAGAVDPEIETDEGIVDDPVDEEVEEQSIPPIYQVKVDGKEVEVTLEDLKRSYSGQSHIQKGMQEAAAARKQAEEVYASLTTEREKLKVKLDSIQELGNSNVPKKPDKSLMDSDPIAFFEQMENYREAVEANETLSKQKLEVQQAQAQQAQAQHNVYLSQQAKILTEKIPEFAEPEKAQKLRSELVSTGVHYGFSEAEITEVADHRAIQVMYDAMKYRQAQAGKATAVTKAKGARPMVKAGSKKSEGSGKTKVAEAARSKMRSTGSVDDVAAYLLTGE